MIRKLLFTLVAVAGALFATNGYAQLSMLPSGCYYGTLVITGSEEELPPIDQEILIDETGENMVSLAIKDFQLPGVAMEPFNLAVVDIALTLVDGDYTFSQVVMLDLAALGIPMVLPAALSGSINSENILNFDLALTALNMEIKFTDGIQNPGNVDAVRPDAFKVFTTPGALVVEGDYTGTSYEIYSLCGQLVKVGSLVNGNEINTSNLNKGLFLLKIKDYTVKFVNR